MFNARKTLIDVVATYNATSALTFILNVDWNKQQFSTGNKPAATWYGAALYTNYSLSGHWRVSVRAEYLDDKDAFLTGTQQTLKEGTITFGYEPAKAFELRAEGRYDKGQRPVFFRTRAALAGSLPDSNNLTGIALQGVYNF